MVITGISGGEFGARGTRDGIRRPRPARRSGASTRFPGPRSEPATNTWPQTGSAWKNGGAPVWADAVGRPEARAPLLLHRQRRPRQQRQPACRGDETCFTASDDRASTSRTGEAQGGTTRWSHHDIWDYDAPRPHDSLRRGRSTAEAVQGIGEAEKDGLALPARPARRESRSSRHPSGRFPRTHHQRTWPHTTVSELRPGSSRTPRRTRNSRAVVKQASQAARTTR